MANYKKIIVYVKTGCPWCGGVLDLLQKNNVPFEERNVLENKDFFRELVEKSRGELTPTLDIDGRIYADSDAEEVKKILEL